MEHPYYVRVLIRDNRPGLIPFNYILDAPDRDTAIKRVRKQVRRRSGDIQRVKHIITAHRTLRPKGYVVHD